MKYLIVGLILTLSFQAFSQSETGNIYGKVTDASTGEEFPFATLMLMQDTVIVNGAVSRMDGKYTLLKVPVGSYKMITKYVGYKSDTQTVSVFKDSNVIVDVKFRAKVLVPQHIILRECFPINWEENTVIVSDSVPIRRCGRRSAAGFGPCRRTEEGNWNFFNGRSTKGKRIYLPFSDTHYSVYGSVVFQIE
jgi:hypothetical protein